VWHNETIPMRLILKILIIALFVSFEAFGQISGVDYLLPAPEFEEGIKSESGYYGKVIHLLNSNFSSKTKVCYTVFPSFSPEYSLSIEKTKDSSYVMILRTCSENYWYSENKGKVTISLKTIKINSQIAQLVTKLFSQALSQCKEHKPNKNEILTIGFDGENYYFSELKQGKIVNVGKTWSPRTYKMKELVSVCESLKDTDKTEEINKRIELLMRIKG
jgi:hypothetical protein